MVQADRARVADERRQFSAPSGGGPASASPPLVVPPSPATPVHRRMRREAVASLPDLRRGVHHAFQTDIERGNGFLFAPVFMAGGALAYFTTSEEPAFTPLLLCLGLALGLAALASARPAVRAALLAAVMFFSGALAGKVETWLASTPMLGSQVTTRLTGRVMRIEHQASGRVRLTLDILATERPTLRYAPHRVRATARTVPPGLSPGDAVRGVVRLMPPSGPVRPQSYDFAFKSYFSGIGASGFFMSGPEIVTADAPPDLRIRIAAIVENWRGRMAGHIEDRIGGPEGAVAAALITGVRAGIPEEINEALRVTGLYHVISISGLHMALVAGTLMVSLRAGFALFPTFSMRRPVKKYAALCALIATGLYLVISGGDVAAQRSFIMLAVMLLAVLFDRAALTMRNLAISALIILVMAPHEVAGPSFQMSFAATAALVAAYGAWRDRRKGRPARARARETRPMRALHGAGGYVVALSMTSLVAGLATALFTAWHFQQVSPLSLVANLAAMPIVSVAVMPMAVLASLLMPFGLDAPPLWLMGQGIWAMNAVAIWLAERSAFDATGAIPLAAVLMLTAALALLTMSESALRWAALPFVIIGVALLIMRDLPEGFVSEDATLMAVRLGDGRIAVNRPRPRGFTIDNWRRAFGEDEIIRPIKGDAGQILADLYARRHATGHMAVDVARHATEASGPTARAYAGFTCGGDLCVARRSDGAVVVHAQNAVAAAPACARASLIVIADATAENPCTDDTIATVITARELARQGSVEVTFGYENERPAHDGTIGQPLRANIRFAITEPYRPWHEHRQYSRSARGLAPFQPPRRSSMQEQPALDGESALQQQDDD